MKTLLSLPIFAAVILTAGCTYNGKLKGGFYHPTSVTGNKIPLKANLICGDFFKSTIIDPGHVYGGYVVSLKTDPALQEALTVACKSLFEEIQVSPQIDPHNQRDADINLLPNLKMEGHLLKLTLVVKNAGSGETIQQYEASQNFEFRAPVGVTVLDSLDIFFCGLLCPIIIPSNTSMIGHRGEKLFAQRMAVCVGQITEDIRYDAGLVAKCRK